jgi:hypothetical protein
MTRSLSGLYAINRPNAPTEFFTPARDLDTKGGAKLLASAHVLTSNGSIGTPDRLCLGIVSAQTPFGQGTRFGLLRARLRRATGSEIRNALKLDHPEGKNFRPGCVEMTYLQRYLDGVERAVAPDAALHAFAHASSRREVEAELARVKEAYRKIVRNWLNLARRQSAAILETLN